MIGHLDVNWNSSFIWFTAIQCFTALHCFAAIQCFAATVLRCYSASLLQCYSATVLHCYTATLLHCYSASLLHCYSASLLQCYSDTLLHCYSASLLHCYTATVLPCMNNKLHCSLNSGRMHVSTWMCRYVHIQSLIPMFYSSIEDAWYAAHDLSGTYKTYNSMLATHSFTLAMWAAQSSRYSDPKCPIANASCNALH